MVLGPTGTAWEPLLERVVAELYPALPHQVDVVPRVAVYLDELITWNARLNLTAARTAEELVDLTLADACILARHGQAGTWVDVGAGAGAPGLILAVLEPDSALTLVEPRAKRVAFLRSVIGRLDLDNVRVLRERSERLPSWSWEFAVSRATLSPEEWLREGQRLARKATWVLLAKGEPPETPSLTIAESIDYRWPLTGSARRAVRYAREVAT